MTFCVKYANILLKECRKLFFMWICGKTVNLNSKSFKNLIP